MEYPKSTSFKKGWREIPQGKVKEFTEKIKRKLGISSGLAFRNRRDGKVEHTVVECQLIEAVFAEYGVTDPWGE